MIFWKIALFSGFLMGGGYLNSGGHEKLYPQPRAGAENLSITGWSSQSESSYIVAHLRGFIARIVRSSWMKKSK